MTLHEYRIINADNQIIGRVLTPTKNDHLASEKIYHKLGAKAYFVRKEYVELVDCFEPSTK